MKVVLIGFGMAFLACVIPTSKANGSVLQDDQTVKEMPNPEKAAKKRTSELKKALGLNEKQTKKIYKLILKEENEKYEMMTNRPQGGMGGGPRGGMGGGMMGGGPGGGMGGGMMMGGGLGGMNMSASMDMPSSSKQKDPMEEARKKIEKREKKIRKILTAEQYEVYEQYRIEQMEKNRPEPPQPREGEEFPPMNHDDEVMPINDGSETETTPPMR